ncbi:MAG TPA: hypothetical protein VJ548_13885 [Azospira sp.]|nr:hypothetical protein [Azospira sp.]
MSFPAFFAQVPRITLRDPLAEFLGAAEGGLIEYGYADAVRLAGHSCPTVAGAYLLTCHALTSLYEGDLPERGNIRVEFLASPDQGVTGVIASVVTLLTGAAGEGGFKGLAGNFSRRQLLQFGAAGVQGEVRFTRIDTGASADASLNLGPVPADPAMGPLLQQILAGEAPPQALQAFAGLWQDRVRRLLLEHWDDPQVLSLRCN